MEPSEIKIIQLKAKIEALTWVETYPCNCERAKLRQLFDEIAAIKWEYLQQLNEIETP
jgi:hypothetical protein